MKRLFILISMFLLVFCGFGAKTSFASVALIMNASEFSVYTSAPISSKNARVTDAGIFYINTIGLSDISSCVNFSGEKMGESFVIKGCDESKISRLQNILKFKEIKREKVGEILVVYAYTNMLKNSKAINNEKVNLQIAFDGLNLTVGYPLILGSF